jgi:hypothetical protein
LLAPVGDTELIQASIEQAHRLFRPQEFKLQPEIESAQGRRIKVVHQVGGGDEHPFEILHLGQHLVDLGNLLGPGGTLSILNKAVGLVEQKHAFLLGTRMFSDVRSNHEGLP